MNRFVQLSDIHFPYQDDKAIKAVIKFIKDKQPEYIILNGDIVDMYDCSSFDKNPDRMNTFQQELNLAYSLFKELRKVAPNAKIIYIEGNHEYRVRRYLMKHPELFSLDALKLPNLLQTEKYGIDYIEKSFQLGSLKFTHGSIVRKFSSYTAHAELDKNDCSGCSGHTHRLGVCYKQTPQRYLAWFESGCLCDIHPEYVDDPDWQQGFLYGYVDKDSFAVTPVPIVNGKIKCVF